MIEIILDASQLEVFEACPRHWYYSYVLNLTPKLSRRAFDIGSYYHKCLEHYYDTFKTLKETTERIRSTVDFSARTELLKQFNINNLDDQKFHKKRLVDYIYYWLHEDEPAQIIAVEQGFSWLLYESDNRRYILEGKIDLVWDKKPTGLTVTDHKTQSRKDDRWEFNHQVMNYLSFTKANYFEYNYIGLQDKLPDGGLRRNIYKPQPGMLEQWQKEVKNTFDQMATYLNKEPAMTIESMESFPRRRAACSNKYGTCAYYKLCSVPDDSKFIPVVFSAYKEKDEKWRAWT